MAKAALTDNPEPITKNLEKTCTVCGEEVTYKRSELGEGFQCEKENQKHQLPMKTYFDLGAASVQSIRDRRLYAPFVILRPRYTQRDPVGGHAISTNGLSVQFEQGGRYSTCDSEEQYYLDRKGYLTGVEGQKAWDRVYLTPEQQLVKTKDELAAVQRQLKEGNSLLEQQKAARA